MRIALSGSPDRWWKSLVLAVATLLRASMADAYYYNSSDPHCQAVISHYEEHLSKGQLCNTMFDSKKGFAEAAAALNREEALKLLSRDDKGDPLFSSGAGQDWWLWLNHARFMDHPGTFVDLATNDPIIRSNTWFLEQCLGWTGLCIEPVPTLHAKIRRERTCKLVPHCISKQENDVDFWVSEFATGGSSHIGPGAGEKGPGHTEKIKCKTLSQVFKENKLKHVDFMSLDIEGHEYDALRTLDLFKYPVDVIIAESGRHLMNQMKKDSGLRKLYRDYGMAFNLGKDSVFTRKKIQLGIERAGGQPITNPKVPPKEAALIQSREKWHQYCAPFWGASYETAAAVRSVRPQAMG